MKKIFISGSISLKKLDFKILASLDKIILKKYKVLVGDAFGIDSAIQEYLNQKQYFDVEVHSIYSQPRNIISSSFKTIKVDFDETLKSEREKQTFKDVFMTKNSDTSFVIWDGKSTGSFQNILRAINEKKEIIVFLDGNFLTKQATTKENITNIFESRHEYSLSEYLRENPKLQIKTVKILKEKLIEKGVLEKKQNEIIPTIKFKQFISEKYIRGRKILKFKKQIFNKIIDSQVIIQQKQLF